jgi:hypothetical protein
VDDVEDPTREMPRGETVELMYRGPLVMMGYRGFSVRQQRTVPGTTIFIAQSSRVLTSA